MQSIKRQATPHTQLCYCRNIGNEEKMGMPEDLRYYDGKPEHIAVLMLLTSREMSEARMDAHWPPYFHSKRG